MPVRPFLAAVLVVLPLLSACGGQDEVTMPPLTPEPGDSRFADTTTADTPAPAKETFPARLALYKYLRGIAVGNAKACAYLTPDYQQEVFGGPAACRTRFARARAKLHPQDLAALRGVTVPVCRTGPGTGVYTVQFEDLAWKGEPARPGGLLAASFTLRKTGAYWQITADAAE